MKVLFDHHFPFLLAHGGFQILIEKLKEGLIENGVEVEYLRWWDEQQSGDIIQFFGRPSPGHIEFAHAKGMGYAMMELLTGQGSRAKWKLQAQGGITRALKRVIPKVYQASFGWESYKLADAILASTPWEAEVMQILFETDASRVHVVPNGVDPEFFQTTEEQGSRTDRIKNAKWLVCLATVTERKRVIEMCEAALTAQTPLWVIGKPYADDSYSRRFLELVKCSGDLIRFEGAITQPSDLAPILKGSRGFVLLSAMETQSVAASAAAAAGCPLLLSDLPWARSSFGQTATYCPILSPGETAKHLKDFYKNSPTNPPPAKQQSWSEVALKLKEIYGKILAEHPI